MGSTFSSYEIAATGMYVSQRGLFTTGHNISNVNTPGYVRQQLMIKDSAPSQLGRFQVGIGADVQQVRQIRDQFLDTMYRNENEMLGYSETRGKMLEEIQTILNEPSDYGLNKIMDQFFQAWHELAKDPGSLTVRAIVRQRGVAFTNAVNHIGAQLDKLQQDINTEIRLKIDDINIIANQIAKLNVNIMKGEAAGDKANDFRDERNLLLDELSRLINVDISEKPNGTVSVAIGGVFLVDNDKTQTIKADINKSNSTFIAPWWQQTGVPVAVRSGVLQGLIESRGNVAGFKGSPENGSPVEAWDVNGDAQSDEFKFDPSSKNIIPELRRGLNILVNLFVRKLNEIHSSGVGIDGSTGFDFFSKIDNNLPFEIGNIRVSAAFDGDEGLNRIAAAATGELPGDNINAQKIADFRREKFFATKNLVVGIDDFYNSIVTWVATTGQESQRIADNQSRLVLQIQNKKESTSGVSLDEEMTNMMKYQHAYNASARVINVIDEMINKIINGMGIVGR